MHKYHWLYTSVETRVGLLGMCAHFILQQPTWKRRVRQVYRYAVNKQYTFQAPPLITVFGSCRQETIMEMFHESIIRPCLNYCQYSKEALQLINDLVQGFVPDQGACYRSVLCGQKLQEWPRMIDEFHQSDAIVVEIVSRYAIELNARYFHQSAYDWAEQRELFPGISRRIQSDDEISADMEAIRDLLHPRPVIFVSHACTYHSGGRAQLRDLVLKTATRLGCTIYDPSELLNKYSKHKLLIDAPNLFYLSEYGNKILAKEYKKLIISTLVKSKEPKLIQIFPDPVSDVENHGFGDFLHGATFVYQQALRYGMKPEISLSGTALSDWLYNTSCISTDERSKATRCYHCGPGGYLPVQLALIEPGIVFTNRRITDSWSRDLRNWMHRACLTPKPCLLEAIDSALSSIGLAGQSYCVIHLRLGDQLMHKELPLTDHQSDIIQARIAEIRAKADGQLVVLSDRPNLVSELNGSDGELHGFTNTGGHIGRHPQDSEVVRNSLVDFFLMGRARGIHLLSVHEWGSGFSELAAMVFDLPLYRYPLLRFND